ncbi:MAG: hypothetical protein WBG32_04110, partial [Nodosilinea sp.]
ICNVVQRRSRSAPPSLCSTDTFSRTILLKSPSPAALSDPETLPEATASFPPTLPIDLEGVNP